MVDGLVSLLVFVLILGVVAAIVYVIINALPIPPQFKQIALLVLLLILLLVILLKALPLLGIATGI